MKLSLVVALLPIGWGIDIDAFCRRTHELLCFIEINSTPRYAIGFQKGPRGFTTTSCDVKEAGPRTKRDAFTEDMAASLEMGCLLPSLPISPSSLEYAFLDDNARVVDKQEATGFYTKMVKLSKHQVEEIARREKSITFTSAEPSRLIQIDEYGNIIEGGGKQRVWKWSTGSRLTSDSKVYHLKTAKGDDESTVAFITSYYFIMIEKTAITFLRW